MKNPYVILAVVLAALLAWNFWPREKPVVGESVQLPPAKEVRMVEKIIIQPKLVYAYHDKSKTELNLPDSVTTDAQKKLIATGKLNAEDRPYTLSGVLDTQTGHAEIYARPDPLPWIGPGKHGAIRLTQWHNGVTQIDASHDLLQVKALHAGISGRADTSGETLVGGYVEYRF